jgi:hypothetical protein
MGDTKGWWSLYFPALLLGTAVPGAFLWGASRQERQTPASRLLGSLLSLLILVQFLFLPVNFGYLYLDKTLPRVSELGDKHTLTVGEEAWLVWEGKDSLTYLIREEKTPRRLLTLPKKDVTRMEIIGYDQIFRSLFREGKNLSS